jgi:hypothetical protein
LSSFLVYLFEHDLKEARKQYYATKREVAELRRLHKNALYKVMADK